ncbi:MAG TPA: MBL fold metallo-hydrolase, partial [Solirubrobacteraceae bacterium]
ASSTEWTEPGAFAVADGIHRIPLPMPNDGLRAVNVYAIENGDGIALVDTGWDHPAAIAALDAGLAAIGASVADLNTIIVTHFHADHYALAGPLRERSGAPVLFPEEGLLGVRVALEPDTEARAHAARDRVMARHGAGGLEDPLPKAHGEVRHFRFAIPDHMLRDGDVVELEDRTLQVIAVPGHTQGHVTFFDESARIYFAADHVLPHITPSIGFEPFPKPLVLQSFLASLEKVRPVDAQLVLPAHGPVFHDLPGRVDELLAHHDRRLADCVRHVAAGHDQAVTVAEQLLWTKRDTPFAALDAFNRYIAIGETIAHLELLAHDGRIGRVESDDAIRFTGVGA